MTNEATPNMISMVRAFHEKAGYVYEDTPSTSNEGRRALWRELISEEHEELMAALQADDIYLVADGIADSLYVLIGAALAFALPIEKIFREVHESNLSKISSEVAWRSDGKIMRSTDYKPPRIKNIIDQEIAARAQLD
jgi:predicted HAD superfamily Cof-like phosphohydrolase